MVGMFRSRLFKKFHRTASKRKTATPRRRNSVFETLDKRALLTTTAFEFSSTDELVAIGESGYFTANQPNKDHWHSFETTKAYEDPVVIMGPLTSSGGHPSTVRVKNVSPTGFEWQIDEWDYLDGAHIVETVGFMVLESGVHTLDNGTTLVAGNVDSDDEFATIELPEFDASPIVLTQISSVNDSSAVTTRVRNVTANQFDLRLQGEEKHRQHDVESVGYVAIDVTTVSQQGQQFVSGRTDDIVTHKISGTVFEQSFEPVFCGIPVAEFLRDLEACFAELLAARGGYPHGVTLSFDRIPGITRQPSADRQDR